MKIILDIYRFNPDKDKEGGRKTYPVNVKPTDRVLDALMHVYRNEDGTIGFRKSCAHGVCGSDAMRINGREGLACKTLIRDVAEKDDDVITLDPLRHMPVQRDLIVDQSVMINKFFSISPFLKPDQEAPEKGEYIQSEEDRAIIDDATKCISCGVCYSVCPVLDDENNPDFLGPMALVAGIRFAFDSRDQGLKERLAVLDDKNAVWSCDSHFECTRACPREIKITKLINFTKRKIKKLKENDNK